MNSNILRAICVLGFVLVVFGQVESKAGASNYKRSCSVTVPLSSYDRCDSGSTFGLSAYSCAENEALAACETANNLDCVVVAVTFGQFISVEFPGFKGCTSVVTVRGWKQ